MYLGTNPVTLTAQKWSMYTELMQVMKCNAVAQTQYSQDLKYTEHTSTQNVLANKMQILAMN